MNALQIAVTGVWIFLILCFIYILGERDKSGDVLLSVGEFAFWIVAWVAFCYATVRAIFK